MLGRLVALFLIATLGASEPAHACRGCKPPTEASLIAEAERVYAARVVRVERSTATLEVDVVWKGRVPRTTTFTTSCELAKAGATVIVLDRAGKPSHWHDRCLEVMRDAAATRARFDKLAGAPRAP